MPRRRRGLSVNEVVERILSSDEESIIGNGSGNESDFSNEEDEYTDTEINSVTAAGDGSSDPTSVNSLNSIERVQTWTTATADYQERHFRPREQPGVKNIPQTIDENSTPADFFELIWDENLWNLFLIETNRRAQAVVVQKPENYSTKSFQRNPLTSTELKAFFGLRVAMEILIQKDRYSQYWKTKASTVCQTPGFANVMSRDRFLAIWTFLHCVNENDQAVNKSDKIYKTRPVLDYLLDKFKHFYVPACELSLDEGMIPTKNRLSFKQYIKAKPVRWGIKTFILCDSANGYICNAEV